jgi:excisionase family DNA binding protein
MNVNDQQLQEILDRVSNMQETLNTVKAAITGTNEPEIIGLKEVSKITGLSLPTLYAYTSQNKIPHLKAGKRLRFKRFEILNWMKEG